MTTNVRVVGATRTAGSVSVSVSVPVSVVAARVAIMTMAAVMITVDCAEPQELARWWATALGGEIAEDHGEFVIVKAQPVALGFQRVAE